MTTPADALLRHLDASPSPYHAAAAAAESLEARGFDAIEATAPFPGVGRWYLISGGALVAWIISDDQDLNDGARIIGAHTDSPNLRIKPRPDLISAGLAQLAVEPYGGLLLNSWLDRDLGLSGRVVLRRPGGRHETRLLRDDRPLLRVPQLAIHLDRDVNERGLLLNRQTDLTPVWGIGASDLVGWISESLEVDTMDISGWDLMAHDTATAGYLGRDDEFIVSARLDNLASCFGAIEALGQLDPDTPGPAPIVVLFDHEEVGSGSATGAAGPLLERVIERIVAALGGGVEERARMLAASGCLSADMAHGTHPNHPERHDPNHHIALGAGMTVKVNATQRYATSALGIAAVHEAAERADVPLQVYAHRSDLACGSTIGPITATRLGIDTVDIGAPMLSMHSIREQMAAADVAPMIALFCAWLEG